MKKEVNKKLTLNKGVVTRLNTKSMGMILGGLLQDDPTLPDIDGSGDWTCDVKCSISDNIDAKTCCKSKGSKKG